MANNSRATKHPAASKGHLAVAETFSADYSSDHKAHIALLDDYFEKVRRQEEMYVKAGFDAEGLTDFLVKWFQAWETRSITALRACLSDDMVYADPSIGSRDWYATQLDYDIYHLLSVAIPDNVFYPQDDTARALPYFDFLDGQVRMTVPWRQVGRIRFTPRSIDVVGVDRYNMVRDPERGWLIARIDTDADILGALGQILPIPLRAPKQKTVHFFLGNAQKLIPALRGPRVRPTVYDRAEVSSKGESR